MVFLLIAVAICLLVPWLPVLMYWRFLRWPPLAPAAGQLQLLTVELQWPEHPETADVVPAEDEQPRTDIGRRPKDNLDLWHRSKKESQF